MRLSVPCNWDEALLDALSPYPEVQELFGAQNATPVGGGRPSAIIKNAGMAEVGEYVREVRKKGWSFNYVLNAPCMGNLEYDAATHKKILSHIEWLTKIGVETVTVTIPYLIEVIKKQFPALRIKASTIANVNTIARARYYRELGADEITLDFMANRDFGFLAALQKAVAMPYVLLVNDLCLYQCPYRTYHYNVCGHASQESNPLQSYYFEYCTAKCLIDKLKDPAKIVQARWIRPEDLETYEAIGYNQFKLSGRDMPTERIAAIVKAYAGRRFDGNLLLLFSPFVDSSDASMPFLDNRSLDGFLRHFAGGNCIDDCDTCGYCGGFAGKAMRFDAAASEKRLATLESFIGKLTRSTFVPGKR